MEERAGRPQATISEIGEQADSLARSDPEAAMRFLERHRQRNDFHPWGELFHMRCAVQAMEKKPTQPAARQEAVRAQVLDLFDAAPDLQPCWPFVLRLTRHTGSYAACTARLLERMRHAPALDEPWLSESVIECLLNHSPEAGAEVLGKAQAGGLVPPGKAEALRRLADFLEAVRQGARGHLPPVRWGFRFGLGPAVSPEPDGCLRINLSALGLEGGEDWQLPLSSPFYNALFALMDWKEPAVEDLFIENWPTMRGEDAPAGRFAQLIMPHLAKDLAHPHAVPKPQRLAHARIAPGDLWVRVGNGQMWALESYLTEPQETCRAARRIAELEQAGEYGQIAGLAAADPWWPRCSPLANVARIAVNAGWYAPPETAEDAFSDWAARYKSALVRGGLLAGHAHTYLPLIPLLPALQTKQLHLLPSEMFLERLNGLSVVFATAFAGQVQAHFNRGGVHAFWRGCGLKTRLEHLTCVTPPMSAWPYRPHRDWSESFASVVHACEEAIHASGAQVFIGACGGYGLPLVDELHRRTGITCVYPGHIANTFFGILTATSLATPFYQSNRRLPHWVRGRLDASYPEIRHIDNGRYAAPGTEGA